MAFLKRSLQQLQAENKPDESAADFDAEDMFPVKDLVVSRMQPILVCFRLQDQYITIIHSPGFLKLVPP